MLPFTKISKVPYIKERQAAKELEEELGENQKHVRL